MPTREKVGKDQLAFLGIGFEKDKEGEIVSCSKSQRDAKAEISVARERFELTT